MDGNTEEGKKRIREERRKLFSKDRLEETINRISENFKIRITAIDKLRRERKLEERVFTGVEADILNPQGKLDLTDEVLSQIDVVIASFHKDEFNDVCQNEIGSIPPYDQILDAYFESSINPLVDVIGHPLIPNQPLTDSQWQKWEQIFKNLAQRDACLEIPLGWFINPQEKEKVPQIIEWLKKAKESGVKFSLSLDFHRLESHFLDRFLQANGEERYQPLASRARRELEKLSEKAKEKIENEKITEFEEEFKKQLAEIFQVPVTPAQEEIILPRYALTLARPIYHAIRQLTNAGITPQDIVDGNFFRFENWVKERKKWKVWHLADKLQRRENSSPKTSQSLAEKTLKIVRSVLILEKLLKSNASLRNNLLAETSLLVTKNPRGDNSFSVTIGNRLKLDISEKGEIIISPSESGTTSLYLLGTPPCFLVKISPQEEVEITKGQGSLPLSQEAHTKISNILDLILNYLSQWEEYSNGLTFSPPSFPFEEIDRIRDVEPIEIDFINNIYLRPHGF